MTESMIAPRDEAVKSVERSIDLVLGLTTGSMTLTELSNQTGLSKSTARRLLKSLGHGGIVVYDPLAKKYLLGPGCLRLGQGFVSGGGGFGGFAGPSLLALRRTTGETVAVHVRLGRHRVCVDELPSEENVRYVSGAGAMAPIHIGSAGRVLLAFLPTSDAAALLDGPTLTPMADGLPVDVGTYKKELGEVRQRGFAMSQGERVSGAAAVSVPIFDADGAIIASLSVLGPLDRFTESKRFDAIKHLDTTASAIRASLRSLDAARI